MVDLNTFVIGLNFGILVGIVVGLNYLMKIVRDLRKMLDKLERLDKKLISMEDEELKMLKKRRK